MKYLALILTSFSLFTAAAFASDCPVIQSQSQYHLKETFWNFGTDFEIFDADKKLLGKVIEKKLTWGTTFKLYDENEQFVATAKKEVFSYAVKIHVYDCKDRLIGSLQEELFSAGVRQSLYSILDHQGQLIGQSHKTDWFKTDISFFNSDEKVVATLSRQTFNFFTDKWIVTTTADGGIDQRILYFTAAYKTSADMKKSSE